MAATYAMTWDLDVFFPGGSSSPEFRQFVEELNRDIGNLEQRIDALDSAQGKERPEKWGDLIDHVQELGKRLRQAGAFVNCLTAQNVKDEQAKLLRGRLTQLGASFGAAMTQLERKILDTPENEWRELINHPRLQPVAFSLEERRRRAAEQLPPEQEVLVGDLAVDGYHAWWELYNTVVGRITIPFEEDGEVKRLSVGQARNKFSSEDGQVRKTVFEEWQKAWQEHADLCASALNHLGGFRLNLYRHRGWDSVLKEPLDNNRMTRETLETMWGVIDENKERLIPYFERKAKLLGLDALRWCDLDAPLPGGEKSVSYDEAADFIIEQFGRFDPGLADFARTAFENRWIEAEDRPNKRPGGFCTTFPVSGQSRIFMTFGGTTGNISTLAHELGHAYHQQVMGDLPYWSQLYAMNVAETASTFAEMIVTDAAIRHASSDAERLGLLEEKLQRAAAFFMDIRARFLFETRFYEERKDGPVSVDRLNQLMVDAQREAFADAMADYDPTFWASKLHFYITGQPFYNVPYTFGFLFSAGINGRAKEDGAAFAAKYADLLRDTGRMTVEDLAARHLGVDLRRPDFWQSAVDQVLSDVDQFLRLSEKA